MSAHIDTGGASHLVDTSTGEILGSDTINYEVHPIAALFPFIEGAPFREFVEDIRANGQREPVVLDADGRLLDGRNRARACQALGIDVKETRYSGDDAEAWIISHNVHRRHLTTSQRAMVAARLATLKNGSNQYVQVEGGSKEPPSDEARTQRSAPSIVEAAAQLNVARESVKRARSIIESGDTDLIKSVESGKTTVTSASRNLRGCSRPAPAAVEPPRTETAVRVRQITDLADQGASSEQIAKALGLSEVYVRRFAQHNGLLIVADQVRAKARRINYGAVLDNATESVEVAAMALRDIASDPARVNREEALERLDSLTNSIRDIATSIKKIKESFHD